MKWYTIIWNRLRFILSVYYKFYGTTKRKREKICANRGESVHWKSKRVSEKTSTFALLTTPKPLTVWITTNCAKFLKRWEYQTTWLASWEICMQIKKQQLELDMEQQTGSIRKGVRQGCILSPCLFNIYAKYIMRNAGLDQPQAEIKTARRNINNFRYADYTT